MSQKIYHWKVYFQDKFLLTKINGQSYFKIVCVPFKTNLEGVYYIKGRGRE
jgi:hypothetical protein